MTPTEIELTNRWMKLYDEKVRLENECLKLKVDYQALQIAFEHNSSLLAQVLKDMRDRDKKENDVYRQIGELTEKNRWLNAKLEKCRQLFADDTNKDNPNWPSLDMKEIPPLRMMPDEEQATKADDEIFDLFKRSSKID